MRESTKPASATYLQGIWLSPKEQMLAALTLEEQDRVPVAPCVGFWYAPKLMGLRVSDYVLGENELRAKTLLAAQGRHGYDWLLAFRGHPRDWRRNVRVIDSGDSYLDSVFPYRLVRKAGINVDQRNSVKRKQVSTRDQSKISEQT